MRRNLDQKEAEVGGGGIRVNVQQQFTFIKQSPLNPTLCRAHTDLVQSVRVHVCACLCVCVHIGMLLWPEEDIICFP